MRTSVLRIGARSTTTLVLVSIAGLMMFAWPFIVTPPSGLAHGHDAPFVFAALLPCLIAVLLSEIIEELARDGHAIVIATHDVELVAHAADRVVVLADGEVVADGPTADIVCASPAFAPQVAKVLQPERWLTVDEIVEALA